MEDTTTIPHFYSVDGHGHGMDSESRINPDSVFIAPLTETVPIIQTQQKFPSSVENTTQITGIVQVAMVNLTELIASNLTGSSSPGEKIHEFDTGEMCWLLACTAITWLMIPGVGFFYNGMAPSKSSLVLIMTCLWSVALVSIQWYIIGYTLCLSNTGGPFIGNVDHMLLSNIGDSPSVGNPDVPALLVGIWYCLFAAITPTIIIGAVAERARFLPSVIFIFVWSTLVFDFLTYWTWNINGWTYLLGALDFGGGTPVHISTGAAALAYALIVGKRKDLRDKPPHNMTHVVLGTSFIWFGWLVANAGSGLKPNLRAVTVFITTNMAASIGGVTWAALDYRREKKFSALGFCSGAVCGLVAITPASGYVSPSSSLAFGFLGSLVCYHCMGIKKFIRIDDAFDVFCVHGIGGIVGNILTGVFAQKSVAGVDGTEIEGGWLDGNWKQVGIQIVDTLAGAFWSFAWTLIILFVLNKIPGLSLREPEEVERDGIDKNDLGESMYQHVDDVTSNLMNSIHTISLSKCNGNSGTANRNRNSHNHVNGAFAKNESTENRDCPRTGKLPSEPLDPEFVRPRNSEFIEMGSVKVDSTNNVQDA